MLYIMTLKNEARFEEKLPVGSKIDMKNLVSFNTSSGLMTDLWIKK